MFNVTIPHVQGSYHVAPCTNAQFNIITAHMIALQYACNSDENVFAIFESDYGTIHRPLESLPYPSKWCVVNVCPTNSAEPLVKMRRAVAFHDFGAVAVVYNRRCICAKLDQLWRRFYKKCEPFDSVLYDVPHSYRTGVMWVEHNYKSSTHSDGWAHKLGPSFVETAREYHRHNE